MSVKEITGLLTILPDKENKNQSLKEELQAGNVSFRSVTLRRTLAFWNNNNAGSNLIISTYPFKQGGLLEDGDINVGHNGPFLANLSNYPSDPTGGQIAMGTFDFSKFRATGTIGTVAAANIPRVHCGLAAYDNLSTGIESAWGGNSIVSASDIPVDYTQIGIVYAHPISVAGAALTTAVGRNYLDFTGGGWWDFQYITPGSWQVLRIATGADAGYYYIQNVDFINNRLYLRNLNGTPFVGQAAATIALTDLYMGPGRRAYFNEVSIIPFSTGTVVTSGRFRPDPLTVRASFILKVNIEKTGSTEVAAAAEQQGSYYVGMKPYTHGDYDHFNGYEWAFYKNTPNAGVVAFGHNFTFAGSAANVGGAVNGLTLNEADQRCWGGHTDTSNNSGIFHWRWRTLESPREVANYLGTAAHASFLTPQLVLATGDRIRGSTMDSKKWVYFAVSHATLGNGGIIIIKPNLTTLQYTESAPTGTGDTIGGTAPNMTLTDAGAVFTAGQVGQSITIAGATSGANNGTFLITSFTSATQIGYQHLSGVAEAFPGTWTVLGVPDSNTAGIVADRTRARVGSAGDVSTTVATNQVNSASGAFTAADIGRAIVLTGGTFNNGTYKIATVPSGTQVTVVTLADGAVSFASGGSGGTFEIGDRLYMFYNNGTNGLNKINYVETLAPGTFLTRTFTSTAGLGANCNVQNINGENQKISIDPANGNVYWLSNDTTQQINKYDVLTNAHTAILITNTTLLSPAGGVVPGAASPATNPGTPTFFNAIHVNSKFDEIWVGSDFGCFKIIKSTFAAATIRRYFGVESTTYVSGTALTTGTGNGTTGLAFSTPNVTLNSSGTPFVATDVGKYVVITGATAAANNGVFPITAFNSSSQIVYTNSAGVAQANYAATFYIVTGTMQRSAGGYSAGSNSNIIRNFWEHPDGRVSNSAWAGATGTHDFAFYSREADTWVWRNEIIANQSTAMGRNKVFDSVGFFWDVCTASGNAGSKMWLGSVEVTYQWTGSVWTPKEIGLGGLPNKSFADTTNPNCAAKPIHSALEDVLYGVKVGFNRQGGATPANNEFLGRGGQTRITATDGATVAGSNVFNGSAFTSGDTGRTLRIETGSEAGIYKITFVNSGQLTLKTMAGANYSAGFTVGSLTYTIWDFGSAGSNAGPEQMTVLLADGVGKDNTQDITGFTYEGYHFKTRLHENNEPRKFMVENPLAVPGSLATKVYYESYARATPQYDAATSNHRALPGVEHTNGRQLLDGIMTKTMNGTVGIGDMHSSPSNAGIWHGTLANSEVLGYSLMVDFGKDVEVGYAVLRVRPNTTLSQLMNTVVNNGLKANVYRANSVDGTPVASSVSRTTGTTNLSATANLTTLTSTGGVGTGDFQGPISLTPTTPAVGQITAGVSTLVDTTNSPFLLAHVGQILRISAGGGADIGSYRVIGFTSSSVISIRNLDQTAKLWTVTSSTVTYEIRDGVREEDRILMTTGTAHNMLVERLLTTTTLQVRTPPNATITNQSWNCIKPTWTHVKKISFSTEAVPPEVKNNGTWVSHDGRERYDFGDTKIYMDFSDLSSAARTGRWWKWAAIPRFTGNASDNTHHMSCWEFFDVSGNRLVTSKYSNVDESRTNIDYFFNNINRYDIIQSANDAMAGISGFNGNVNLTGAGGDTLTLTTGGNKFLGFQIGPSLTDGGLPIGTNIINSLSSVWPASAMLGRMIRITTGANAGNFYRVASRLSATQVTVTTPSGSSVSWGVAESGIFFSVHEGFNVGGVSPDKFTFLEDGKEFTITTINDALTTLTFSETLQPLRTNKTWEIRRPGYSTTSATTEATKTSRLVSSTYPVQSGDMFHDHKGCYRFFAEDIGTGFQRANGVIAGGNGILTGTGFVPDDVGRLLYIISGTATQLNNGIYEIQTYTSATSITVKNHYTGAAVSFTADAGPVTYQIYGDRRFKLTRFVVGLRA